MSTLRTADGLSLQIRAWAAAAAPRGQILLVHGLGEHGGRYRSLARQLASQGWRVVAYDQRGHGASDGARGRIAADDSLMADLARVLDALRRSASAPPGPLVLMGHSLGGLVAARFVAEALMPQPAAWSRPVEALVLSSPALDAGLRPFQKALISLVSRLAPNLAVSNGLNPDWISRDPAVVRAYRADPLVHDRISGRLGRFIRDAGAQVQAVAAQWRVPTLLMWSGADRCVVPGGSLAFAEAAPAWLVSAREWRDLAHEILNEPEAAAVMACLQGWLDDLPRP